jgi:hypothetical protein
MNATSANANSSARTTTTTATATRNRSYRVVRQLHLWIGAWGAIAAVVYGFSGLVMNHRFGDAAWPQGESEERGRQSLLVPQAARTSPEQMSLWLQSAHGLDAQLIRKGAPGGAGKASPPKWSFSGGSAREAWSVEFTPGGASAELKRNAHSPLSAVNRLHKGVGGGWAWILLADSFAIGMLLLGLSGLWMWLRGRSAAEMVVSVFGISTLALAVVLGIALR